MQETGVWFLGQKDALEKEMAIHFSILAWEIPWTGEPGGRSHDLVTKPPLCVYLIKCRVLDGCSL